MKADDAKRLKELERENQRLKPIVADQALDIDMLRVQRLCLDEGLRVRVEKCKRARQGQSTNPQDRLSATRPNHGWALDFQFEQTSDCRVLKYLNITDEFSKEALAIEVERSMSGDDIVKMLEALMQMDNCTEMASNTVANWCRFSAADISFIDPGSLWQNAYVESFNGKLRDELLGIVIFTTLPKQQSWPRNAARTTIRTDPLITGIHDTARIQAKLAPQQPMTNNPYGTLIEG